MKHFKTILLTIVIAFLPGNVINVRAQENIPRKQLFDYNWKFYLGDVPAASSKNFEDTNWRNLDLPHDWSIEGKIDSQKGFHYRPF